jgi:aspartokinase
MLRALHAHLELLQRDHDHRAERLARQQVARDADVVLENARRVEAAARREVEVLSSPIARLATALLGRTAMRDAARQAHDAALAALMAAGRRHADAHAALDEVTPVGRADRTVQILADLRDTDLTPLPTAVRAALRQLVQLAREDDVQATLGPLLEDVERALADGHADPQLEERLVAVDERTSHVVDHGTEPLSPLIAALAVRRAGLELTPTLRKHAERRLSRVRRQLASLGAESIHARLVELERRHDLRVLLGEVTRGR